METDNITIFEEDLESAQMLCGSISDTKIRNRAVANIVGAKIASRFFDNNVQTDSETGLHNIAGILERVDISDLYVNNSYIDVRVYFNNDELCVPKSHFDLGILPVVYMFIKLNSDLSAGTVMGFIKPDNVNKDNLEQGYYYIAEDSLVSYYDIESHLSKTLDTIEVPAERLYEYAENTIDEDAKITLVKDLVQSRSSRIKLAKIIKAQSIYNFVSIPEYNESEVPSEEQENTDEDNLNALYVAEDEEVTDEEQLLQNLEYSTEVTPSNANLLETNTDEDVSESNTLDSDDTEEQNSEEIENLFNGEQEGVPVKNKKSSPLTIILLFLLLIGCGYFAYTNYIAKNNTDIPQNNLPEMNNETKAVQPSEKTTKEEAMPVETVEATQPISEQRAKKEEAVSVAIPAIEKHLDASVLVSNLRVEWEIPSGYVNNSSAKHYLYKLGKIIQLNLKTELLLLSKPPLSNKITVELNFNPNIGKFEFVGIRDSSGEKTVDDAIVQTVKTVLNMHLNSNTDTFGKLSGNPILIIRL